MRGQAHRALRLVVVGVSVLLGVLHVAVLARRVVDGTWLEPLVIAQWLVAIGLVAVAIGLRRQGVSVFRGRTAAAFWIVIALMHGMVALPGAPGLVGVLGAIPGTSALPVGAGLLLGALAVLTSLLGTKSNQTSLVFEFLQPAPVDFPTAYKLSSLAARAPPA